MVAQTKLKRVAIKKRSLFLQIVYQIYVLLFKFHGYKSAIMGRTKFRKRNAFIGRKRMASKRRVRKEVFGEERRDDGLTQQFNWSKTKLIVDRKSLLVQGNLSSLE